MAYKSSLILAGIVCLSLFLFHCKPDDPVKDLEVTFDTTGLSCFDCNDASITLHVSGGTEPYEITWSNGRKTAKNDSLAAGSYSFIVKDKDGRAVKDTVLIDFAHELIKIKTDYGDMLMWLYYQTPKHRANFLKITREGYYDSNIFHRVVINFVIQTGDSTGTGYGGKDYKIDPEFVPTIKHDYAAVGAARDNNPEKKSHGSQFYICVNPSGSHHLDNNYTVFGKIIEGMPVAVEISKVPVSGTMNTPVTPVYMQKLSVVKYTGEELKSLFGFQVP